MTISFNPSISPVRHLLSSVGITTGYGVADLACAINRLPTHHALKGPHPLHSLLARLAVRELLSTPNAQLTEADICRLEQRTLRILAGQPKSLAECRKNALKHYQKFSAGHVLTRHHIERCIHNRLPRLLPNKKYCAELSTQALLQLIAPSIHPVESVSSAEWTHCALLLFQQCSTTP